MEGLAVLVISCDKYSDLWYPFFELKERYWPDCRYDTFLGTNSLKYKRDKITTICIGEDISWADNVREMLDQLNYEYILLLLEDFFIDRKIDSKYIHDLYEFMKVEEIDCLRLEPNPSPVRIFNHKLKIGMLVPGMPYYVSTQPAIWRKRTLLSLLEPGYSAWEFEEKK